MIVLWPVLPALLAVFTLSVLGLLWQSSVRDRYLRDPDLAGAEAVRRARPGGLLARGGFTVATVGLFLAGAWMLGFRQRYGEGIFIPVAVVGGLVAYVALPYYFHRRNVAYVEAFWDTAVLPPNSGRRTPYVVTLRRWPLMNRVTMLYLTERMLCAAVASGTTPFANRPGGQGSYDPDMWVDATTELLYDKIDVTGPVFLALRAGNFQLAWRDIARIDFDKRTRRWLRWFSNSGRITIHPRVGRPVDFILAGVQPGDLLKTLLDEAIAAGTAKDLLVEPASGADS